MNLASPLLSHPSSHLSTHDLVCPITPMPQVLTNETNSVQLRNTVKLITEKSIPSLREEECGLFPIWASKTCNK